MKIRLVVLSAICAALGMVIVHLNYCGKARLGEGVMLKKAFDVDGVVSLFAVKPADIKQQTTKFMEQVKATIEKIIAILAAERSYKNTAQALDDISLSNLAIANHVFEALELLSPDEAIRNAAHEYVLKIQEFWVDQLFNNKALYLAFKAYVDSNSQQEDLSQEQRYFLTETIKDFERAGLGLPDEQLDKVRALKKEIAAISLDFERNIAQDKSSITVSSQDLTGLTGDFISNLEQTDDGKFILGVDYPTYFNVMDNCAVAATRKNLYYAFMNRAYPANEALLKKLIAKRDELAKLLGYDSFAHLDIDDQMAQTPERAQSFIKDLIQRSRNKVANEIAMLTQELPTSVLLTADGKIQPWDFAFLKNEYKKKHFAIDERKIAEYFPMKQTVEQLLDIYRQFLSVEFEEVPVTDLWHETIKIVRVYDKDRMQLCGTLMLDLFPRPNKYSHAAHITIIPGVKRKDDGLIPDVSIVMANFPKPTKDKPSLLKRSDVRTFFHEFGHAIHAILGATSIASLSGTNTKTDFVELPSQMLEEWLWDKDILKKVSSHYQTGDSLPDEIIDNILALKKLTSGNFVERQGFLSMIALSYYQEEAEKDPYNIMRQLHKEIRTYVAFAENNHFYSSFGHLPGYGSKYYGYLWSNVFALDIFSVIKEHGLLNPKIGQKYVQEILSQGGSKDPNELLRNFLGREPSNEAFLKNYGLI